ncbi:cytidine deaminase [Sphingopyxis sp. SE2]|uniref:cytidine deaminase n=1 Tax=Sphingopyxis sp. SE2 TaxID=1586240 RepID=UPI0028C23B93|nr:cytidine deaminase [Sphingopyxis sp. SE2]MDT7531623.1 cytidine deaminase [Sphingopyxis sp. SE2]
MSVTAEDLFERAQGVRMRAHAPYSHFLVGAAIEDDQGHVHVGCNVENVAYPQGACAEANAIGAMVSAGGRRIRRIAVIGGRDDPIFCAPCGGCRQRILEFADQESEILLRHPDGRIERHTIETLLPASFKAF